MDLSSDENLLQIILNYSSLGYDLIFTTIVGKDAIRMVKRYSHIAEKHIVSEQIYNHEELCNEKTLRSVANFLYNDIQEQEKTKTFRQSMSEYLKDN
jgi:hypothetical protein